MIGVDGLKDKLTGRLGITDPGPGYIHFRHTLDADWFTQFTNEKLTIRYVKGRPVREWVPKRENARNEAFDCAVYATAALHALYANGLNLAAEVAALRTAPMRAEGAAPPPMIPRPTVFRSSWLRR